MKNHIKNCIKTMGLAAVPFGTAQAADCEIKVTQEYIPGDPKDPKIGKDGAMCFTISVPICLKEPRAVKILWPLDKERPNPIDHPVMWFKNENSLNWQADFTDEDNWIIRGLEWASFYHKDAEDYKAFGFTDLMSYDSMVCKSIKEKLDKGQSVEMFVSDLKSSKSVCRIFPRPEFPEGCYWSAWCFCGSYWVALVRDEKCRFFPSVYTLLVYNKFSEPCSNVISHVPTAVFGNHTYMRVQNAVLGGLSKPRRELVLKSFFRCKNIENAKICTFVSVDRNAGEIQFKGEDMGILGDVQYFVQIDLRDKITTGIWKNGKRLAHDMENVRFKTFGKLLWALDRMIHEDALRVEAESKDQKVEDPKADNVKVEEKKIEKIEEKKDAVKIGDKKVEDKKTEEKKDK